jgi:hypothetical protein
VRRYFPKNKTLARDDEKRQRERERERERERNLIELIEAG